MRRKLQQRKYIIICGANKPLAFDCLTGQGANSVAASSVK